MNIEQKLAHMQEEVMKEARAEGGAIMEQHRKALQSLASQHQAEAKRQSRTRIKAEEISARQQLSIAVSQGQLDLKRAYGEKQSELKKKLFGEVHTLLDDFMKTEAYKRLLVEYIEKAAEFANGLEMTIYINPSDEGKKEFLEEHTGMALTVSKEDFIGGIRSVIPGRNILIDHAYKGALESEYRSFKFKGGVGIA